MNNLLKYLVFSLFCIFSQISCVNAEIKQQTPQMKKINFTEERRLNKNISLEEGTILKSTQEVSALYKKLSDSQFSRSAPIPVLEGNESIIVLKPKLKTMKYGDINVERIENKGSEITVFYKEIVNGEYEELKQANPLLLLKIDMKPSIIKLKLIN